MFNYQPHNCRHCAMNCLKCFHPHQAHEFNKGGSNSLLRVGRCLVPGCECAQYVDKIEKIDEDLL